MKLNPTNRFRSARAGALTALTLFPMALPVHATDLYWEGTATSQSTWEDWNTSTFWDVAADGSGGNPSNLVPGANDKAFFNTTVNNTAGRGVRMNTNNSIDGLIFNTTGGSTVASQTSTQRTLTIGASGVTMNLNAGAATLGTGSRSINVTIGANQTWTNNVATANLLSVSTNSIVNLGGNTLTIGGIGNTSFLTATGTTSNIIGTGNLIKTGTGTLTFTFITNTGVTTDFTGTTTLSNGLIVLNSATALRNSTIDTTGSIVGTLSAGFRVTPTTLTLGGVSGNKNLSTVFSTTSGGYTGITALTLNTQAGVTSSYSADLGNGNGSMSLTKTGAGTQILSGTQSYSGALNINAGALVFANKAAKNSVTAIATAPGSIGLGVHASDAAYYSVTDVDSLFNSNSLAGFNLNPGAGVAIDTTNAGGSFDQTVALTAARSLTKVGTGTLILSQTNTYSGVTTISGGTVSAGSTNNLGDGSVTNTLIFGGGILQTTGNITTSRLVTLNAGGGAIDTNGNAVTIDGVISGDGGLTKNGAGTLTSSAENSFTGPLTINGGTLEFSNIGGSQTVVYGSTQININNGSTLSVIGSGNLKIFENKNYTFGSSGGGTIQLGTGNYDAGVNPAIPFSITTTGGARNNIQGGGAANGFNLGGSLVTFDVAPGSDANSDLTIASVIANDGSVLKTGSGRLTFEDTIISGIPYGNIYNGTTTVSNGTLLVNGNQSTADGAVSVNGTSTLGGIGTVGGAVTVGAGATIAPGASIGTLTVDDNVTLDGAYACEVNGTGKDLLAVTGDLDVDGATLAVSPLGAGLTQPSYVIATYTGSLTGTFTVSPALPAGYTVDYTTTGQIKLVSASTPYDTWATTKGLTGLPGSPTDPAKGADPDKDGRNNIGEFAFNGDPLSGSDNGKIYVLTEDSDFGGDPSSAKELILTVAVRTGTAGFAGSPSPTAIQAADGLTYSIEGSLDLAGFLTTVNVVSPIINGLPVDPGAGYEYRSFSLDGSNGLTSKGFLRAKATSP